MGVPHDHDIEAAQLMLQINQEQIGDSAACHLGYIGGVDPTTNKVQVVVPTWTNDDQTYMQTGWIPLGTHVAGNQYGIQLLPFGNATVTNPTGKADNTNNNQQQGAEQVIVHVLNRQNGLYVTGIQRFNNVDVPPSGYKDKSGIAAKAGEWLFKHASGSFTYNNNAGAIQISSLTNPAPILQPKDAPDDVTQLLNMTATGVGENSNSNGNKVKTVNSTVNIESTGAGGTQETNSTIQLTANMPTAEAMANNTATIPILAQVVNGAVGMAKIMIQALSQGATQDNAEFDIEAKSQSQGGSTGNITIDAGDIGSGNLNITVKGQTAAVTIGVTGQTNEMDITVQNGIVNLTCDTTNVKSGTINLGTGTMKALLTDVYAQWMQGHTHSGVMSGSDTTGPMVEHVTTDQEAKNANAS